MLMGARLLPLLALSPPGPRCGVRLCSTGVELASLKVVELKSRLREEGLPVSGTKAVLIERLLAARPSVKAAIGGTVVSIEHCKS